MSFTTTNLIQTTHQVLRMNVPINKTGYNSALDFWKSLERQYMDRRKRLLLEHERLRAAKSAMEHGLHKPELKAEVKVYNDLVATEEEERFADSEDTEFSDVDPDYFVDPGAQYYSGLNRERWHQITTELENLHSANKAMFEMDHRGFLRGCIMGGILIAAILLTAIALLWKTMKEPDEELCHFHCTESHSTLAQEIFRTLFPLGHADDEV